MEENKNFGKRLSIIALILLVAAGSFSLGSRYGSNSVTEIVESENSESEETTTGNELTLDSQYFENIDNNIKKIVGRISREYLNEYDLQKIEDGIYKGLMESLGDPYSVFYTEKEYKELNEQTSGEFGGIGVQVSAQEGENIVVIAPIKGTPGETAGIQPGDKITHIEGEAFFAKDMDKAVGIMRGEPGTSVTITVKRGEGENAKTFDLTITRAIINVDSVYFEMLENNIGYIQLTGFMEKSATEFKNAYNELKSKGAKKIILDLRNNPGGLLDVTMEIADFILDEAVVINIKDKNGKEEVMKTRDGKEDFEMVTLINGGSASASEVLSGALQDHKRSIIVGEKSFGKGVIQNVYPFYNKGKEEGLKLTIAEFFTPNNKKIHSVGITPDHIVNLPEDVKEIGIENLEKDTQLQKAIELLK